MSEWPSLNNMVSSVFSINDATSTAVSATNIKIVEVAENIFVSANNNSECSSASLDFLLHAATDNGGKSFNIFIQSINSKASS